MLQLLPHATYQQVKRSAALIFIVRRQTSFKFSGVWNPQTFYEMVAINLRRIAAKIFKRADNYRTRKCNLIWSYRRRTFSTAVWDNFVSTNLTSTFLHIWCLIGDHISTKLFILTAGPDFFIGFIDHSKQCLVWWKPAIFWKYEIRWVIKPNLTPFFPKAIGGDFANPPLWKLWWTE